MRAHVDRNWPISRQIDNKFDKKIKWKFFLIIRNNLITKLEKNSYLLSELVRKKTMYSANFMGLIPEICLNLVSKFKQKKRVNFGYGIVIFTLVIMRRDLASVTRVSFKWRGSEGVATEKGSKGKRKSFLKKKS